MKIRVVFFLVMVALLVIGISHGDTPREVKVTFVSGSVEYMKSGAGEWISVEKGMILVESDVVRTGENSRCTLLFKGMSEATVDLRSESKMELRSVRDFRTGEDTELDLSLGAVLVKAESLRGDSSFKVRTPNSIVGIRGTEFEVSVE